MIPGVCPRTIHRTKAAERLTGAAHPPKTHPESEK